MNEAKYPQEALCFRTKTKDGKVQALSVTPYQIASENRPMRLFDENFSRIVFGISGGGGTVIMNVKVDEIPALIGKLNICCEDYIHQQMKPQTISSNVSDRPAFTVRFVTGKFKGKSCVDVMRELGQTSEKELKDQYDFLSANLEKYPANQKLMDAILDAGKLTPEEINSEVATSTESTSYKLLELNPHPLTRKARDDGKAFCYEGSIEYLSDNRYPFVFTIRNYYANYIKTEDGLLNVQKPTKVDEVIKTQRISVNDAFAIAKWLDWLSFGFAVTNFGKQCTLSEQLMKEVLSNSPSSAE